MKILVLGGDGFCGWPTALHLSDAGHDVVIVDSLARRRTDIALGVQSLTPIASVESRVRAWNVPNPHFSFEMCDLADPICMAHVLTRHSPDAVVHFAEQRSAPYSMRDKFARQQTVANNLAVTHNLLSTLVDCKMENTHVVHLGTMGVYGYGHLGASAPPIPEGYVNARLYSESGDHLGHVANMVYPPSPGSVYHMTKVMDAQMFQFYACNDGLRITDLHQGIVWGIETEQTKQHEKLINRFDYDGHYGTVLNRFIMQAAIGHPLTVHGIGEQTRAFIHIQDTVRCIELALKNPPDRGERPQINNQMTECHRIIDLAHMIANQFGATIDYVDNPRKEASSNNLAVQNIHLLSMGLQPTLLSETLEDDVYRLAKQYIDRVDRSQIPARTRWSTFP